MQLDLHGTGVPQDFYISFVYHATRDEAGQIDGIFVHATEVTDLVKGRQRIEESEDRFRTLAATIPQLIWTAKPDGSVDYLSEQWADYIGLPPERLYDWGWEQVVHPDDLPNTLRAWRHSVQTGEPLEIKHRFRYLASEWRWQLVRGLPIRDGVGSVTKWAGTCTDIEDQIRIEDALRESQERRQLAMESAGLAAWSSTSKQARSPPPVWHSHSLGLHPVKRPSIIGSPAYMPMIGSGWKRSSKRR